MEDKKKKREINKRMILTFICSLLILIVAISTTIAWFSGKIEIGGNKISTGVVSFDVAGYDDDAKELFCIQANQDGTVSNASSTQVLLDIDNLSISDDGTAYLKIEDSSTVNIDYTIDFTVLTDGEDASQYIGGFWYALTDITNELTDNSALLAYVNEDTSSAMSKRSLLYIERDSYLGEFRYLEDEEETNVHYYRIDIGFEDSALLAQYTDNDFEIAVTIYGTQEGKTEEEDGGVTYSVATESEFEAAMNSALSGDTIRLIANIEITGDVIFNYAMNLDLNSFNLTIYGNLMYDYQSTNSLTIKASGNGRLEVLSTTVGGSSAGGNLEINTPNADVTFEGSNTGTGDIMVEKDIIINAEKASTEDEGTASNSGFIISNSRIVDTNGALTDIYIASNTRVAISAQSSVGSIKAQSAAQNITIINVGTLETIDLSSMYEVAGSSSTQIYIENSNCITNPIILPSWSKGYITSAGSYNTRVIQEVTGQNTEVTGSTGFLEVDIELITTEELARPITEGDYTELYVFYQDKGDVSYTLESLLKQYFIEAGYVDSYVNMIYSIEKLVIISVGDKQMTSTDFTYLRSTTSLCNLTSLDLSRAKVTDGTNTDYLPTSALSGATHLTELVVPESLLGINSSALSNVTGLTMVLEIPETVTYYATDSMTNMEMVYFASNTVSNASGATSVMVDEENLTEYQAYYSTLAYVKADLCDDNETYIRLVDGVYELVYIKKNASTKLTDPNIGLGIQLDGVPISIASIGEYALNNNTRIEGTVTIADTVLAIKSYAFYYLDSVIRIEANSVRTFDEYAFYTCGELISIDMSSATRITGCVFFDCYTLREIVLGDYSEDFVIELSSDSSCDWLAHTTDTILKIYVPYESYEDYHNAYVYRSDTSGAYSTYTGASYLENTYLYIQGEIYGENYVGGYNIGTHILTETADGYMISACNVEYINTTSNVYEFPDEFNGGKVTAIGPNAYRQVTFQNIDLTISDQITAIGCAAFYNRDGITSVTANGAITVENMAFYKCSTLAEVSLPSVEILGDQNDTSYGSFYDCDTLIKVEIPSVREIYGSTFYSCAQLRHINIGSYKEGMVIEQYTYSWIEGIYSYYNIYVADQESLDKWAACINSDGTTASLNAMTSTIYESMYIADGNTRTIGVTQTIDGVTFTVSEGRLVSVSASGDSVTKIVIPSVVTETVAEESKTETIYEIAENAFYSVRSTMTSVTLPSTLEYLSNTNLNECDTLESISVDESNLYFSASSDGVLLSKDGAMLIKYPRGKSESSYIVADTIYGIASNAFYEIDALTSIEFGSKLQVIDSNTFVGCDKLSAITFTGTTPPLLMGTGIFDISIDGFKINIAIPTDSELSDEYILTSYLVAHNFGEYEDYINTTIDIDISNMNRSQVPIADDFMSSYGPITAYAFIPTNEEEATFPLGLFHEA